MKDKINAYEMTTPREGLTQYKFSGHGYTLSVATHEHAYADKDSCEIALLDEHDHFIPLTRHDNVAGYIPRDQVDGLLSVLETCKTPPFRYFHHKYETDWD